MNPEKQTNKECSSCKRSWRYRIAALLLVAVTITLVVCVVFPKHDYSHFGPHYGGNGYASGWEVERGDFRKSSQSRYFFFDPTEGGDEVNLDDFESEKLLFFYGDTRFSIGTGYPHENNDRHRTGRFILNSRAHYLIMNYDDEDRDILYSIKRINKRQMVLDFVTRLYSD